ncbi:MAG: GIY-YIG nuclease family protein [Saprospiraceae bacterium]
MKFQVYILCSERSGRLYIGQTGDLERRLSEHNAGETASTRGKGPWRLLYSKGFDTRHGAMSFENKLKRWKSRKRVLAWIAREKGEDGEQRPDW